MTAVDDTRARQRRLERARHRASYPGEVVPAGTAKPMLYEGLAPLERLARMTALCRAQWLASGRRIERRPRSAWPGEAFRISRG
jgi:hypothetical protein